MAWSAFAAAFGLTAVAELGDKTQLAVVSLSTRYSRRAVLVGAIAAEVLMAGLAVGFGAAALAVVPASWLQVAAAVVFVGIGAYVWWRRQRPEVEALPFLDERRAAGSTFGIVALGEMGDKTQLAIVAVTATTAEPWAVLLGASLAEALMMAVAVAMGNQLSRRLGAEKLSALAAILFLAGGLLLLLDAFLP